MKVSNYQNLSVWKKSMDLVVMIYEITDKFPKSEIIGLTSQMRRAAASIPANIAEGSRRNSSKEFHRFLSISFGSGAELETFMQISLRLKLIKSTDYQKVYPVLEEVMKMLNVMTRKTN